jgi:hypothetical protein
LGKWVQGGKVSFLNPLSFFLPGQTAHHYKGPQTGQDAAKPSNADKLVLIMDEVDGMSGGDRGGVGALNALIKKTKIPIIAICNDRGSVKMKPLMSTTYHLQYRR